ncbi:MAG: nucleoside 2-deoxyribosyltransferase [Bdellovibrionales bacterium]|nr:nucleoside 2-deoxyribosyltransferase [Bdellovibrionales bacterium]
MYRVYLAGELFSLKHLSGNLLLADALHDASGGTYRCILPQDLEQRETTPLSIRNQDISAVLRCDLGLFHFDGPEPDSGTIVEFMLAKMLDIPSVIVRTDFRKGGDQGSEPWNLMMSFYPRSKTVLLDAMAIYQRERLGQPSTVAALKAASNIVAREIISAFREVQSMSAVLQKPDREAVYRWFRSLPGSGFSELIAEDEMKAILLDKESRGLYAEED